MISQEIINRIGLREERVPLRTAMGRSVGDGKTDVEEEGAIGDELAGGSVSVCGQRV